MDPAEARKLVTVALPERPAIDESALDKPTRTHSELQKKLNALDQANRQTQTMEQFARSLLDQAQPLEERGCKSR